MVDPVRTQDELQDAVFSNMPLVTVAATLERQATHGPDPGKPSFLFDTVPDAFTQWNGLLNAASFAFRPTIRDEIGYNAFEEDRDIVFADPDFAEEYVNSGSPLETRLIRSRLMEERRRLDTIGRSGAPGYVAAILAGLLSPENLIPVGAIKSAASTTQALKGLSRARQAAILSKGGFGAGFRDTAIAAGFQEVLASTAIRLNQASFGGEEQFYQVMGALVLGGALGGGAGAIGESRRGFQQLIGEEIKDGLTTGRVLGMLDDPAIRKLPSDRQRAAMIERLASQGHTEIARMMADPKTWLGRLWRKGVRWHPQLRLGSSNLGTHRELIKRLTDNPMLRVTDVKLGRDVAGSVEAQIVLTYGRVADTILQIRDIFVGMRKAGVAMGEKDFRVAITRAMRNNDKATPDIVNPGAVQAINEAAVKARKMFDSISEDAELVGLLARRDLKGTALSYVTRVWDRDKVRKNRAELKSILMEHFRKEKDPGKAADAVLDHIEGSRTGAEYIPPSLVGEAGPFRERMILIEDHLIEQFLENDIVEVLGRFVNEVAPQVEMAKAFRTGSAKLDQLPARLERAITKAEQTGDKTELIEIMQDTASLRAGAALASQFTEEGLLAQRRIDSILDRMPELRSQHRELTNRWRAQTLKDTQYRAALETRTAIEKEIGGPEFDNLPGSVTKAFEREVESKPLASTLRDQGRKEAALKDARSEVVELRRQEKRELAARDRSRKRKIEDLRLEELEVTPDGAGFVRRVEAELERSRGQLTAARARVKKADADLKVVVKRLREKRRVLFKSETTRRKFFHTWRRWVMGDVRRDPTKVPSAVERTRRVVIEARELFPETQAALKKLGPAASKGMRGARTRYIAATKRVESMRNNISRVRANAKALGKDVQASGAALEEANDTLLEFRREAHDIDPGVALEIRVDKKAKVADVAQAARNGVSDARRADAMRAVRLDAFKAAAAREARALAEKTPARALQIDAELKNELKDVDVVRDRLLNRAGIEKQDPHHWAFRAERTFRRINFMRFMGKVVISSIPDLAMPILVNGFMPTMRAWRTALRAPLREFADQLKFRPTKTLADVGQKEEMVRLMTAIELADGARMKSFGDVGDMVAGRNGFERGVDQLSDVFAQATLINRWNAFHKGIATLSAMNRAMDDIGKLVKTGTLDQSARANLAAAGINKEMAGEIWEQFKKHGTREKGQVLPRTQDWDNLDAKLVFQQAMIADVRRTIITPSAGDLPRWMSKPFLRLMGQFRAFAMSSTSKILASGLQRHDAAVAQGAVFGVMMGGVVYALNELIKGKNPFDQPAEVWLQNAIDRSGLLGFFTDLDAVLSKATHGRAGVSALTQGGVPTRYQARNVVDAFVGPTAGTATDIVALFGAPFGEGGATAKDLHTARRMVPFNQIFYMKHIVDSLEGTVGELLDLPPDRRAAIRRAEQ